MSKKLAGWYLIGSIGLSFLLYGNTIGGDFVYDDQFYSKRQDLRQARALVSVWDEPLLPQHREAGLYRPLMVFSLALNFILFGPSTVSFHILNIIINGLNVFLVFLLTWRLFKRKNLAIFASLIFAFWPIHTEAVAFIKSRDELLAMFFIVLAWLFFIKGTENPAIKWRKIFISSLFFITGVLSKELSIISPLAFLGVFWLQSAAFPSRIARLALAYLPASLIYLAVRYQVLGKSAFGSDDAYFVINPLGYVDYWTRFWTAFKIAFIYIGKTIVPINLSATYNYNHLSLVSNPFGSIMVWLGILFLSGLIFLAIYRKTRSSPLGVGAVTFLVTYAAISKFIFKAGDILGERWIYLPSLGLAIILGYGLTWVHKKNKWLAGIATLFLLIYYGSVIISRNRVWQSNEKLYSSMIKTAPNSIQGHLNMADIYLDRDQIEEARNETELAFAIYKDHAPLMNLIGTIAYKDGNYDLSETAFLKAIELRPKLPISYSNVAKVYYKTGHYEEAETALRNVVYLYPKAEDVILYALSLAKLQRYQESIDIINRYLSHELNNSQVRFVLAVNYYKLNRLAEARKYFDWITTKSEAEKILILRDF